MKPRELMPLEIMDPSPIGISNGDVTNFGVVVIGRNEGDRLAACLKSMPALLPRLVYVDSGSTDGSIDVARRFGATIVELSAESPFTAARARNEGAARLLELYPDLEFVQFVDGDCVLSGEWLFESIAFMRRHPKAAVVCGRRQERNPAASIYNRLCDMEWAAPAGMTASCGGDALMRVSAFRTAGGYVSALIAGEEPELCLRLRSLGWQIWRMDCPMTLHDANLHRFGQWWTRAMRGGHAMAQVVALHWNEPQTIWKKQLASALFWGFFLPVGVISASLCWNMVMLSLLIYPAQLCRIALEQRVTQQSPWLYASFVMLAKFAEVQGALTFWQRRRARKTMNLIEYK